MVYMVYRVYMVYWVFLGFIGFIGFRVVEKAVHRRVFGQLHGPLECALNKRV